MDKCSIYLIRRKRNNKLYIGQTWETVKHRFGRHTQAANRGSKKCPKLYNAIRCYGAENFIVEKIDECYTQSEADLLEDFYILAADSIRSGYNCKRGGSTGKHSEESKKKISDSKRGIPRTEECIRKTRETKLREGLYHHGEDHCRAILTNKDVIEIKKLLKITNKLKKKGKLRRRTLPGQKPEKYSRQWIADKYSVSYGYIADIDLGKKWKHIKI